MDEKTFNGFTKSEIKELVQFYVNYFIESKRKSNKRARLSLPMRIKHLLSGIKLESILIEPETLRAQYEALGKSYVYELIKSTQNY